MPLLANVVAASSLVFVPGPACRQRTGVAAAVPSSSSAVPVVSAALATPSATHTASAALAAPSAAPLAPPVLVPSVPATPHSRSLRAMVAPLVPSVPPVPAWLCTLSCSARAPPARNDPFALHLCLGASPSPGAAPPDTPPSYSAVAPLPAVAVGPATGPADVQRHPWNGNTKVGPGAGPSAHLTPLPRRVLSSVGAPSARPALSRAAPPVAAAAAATTAMAAADEEDDDPVPVRRHGSRRSCASDAPSAARASTEVVVIDDNDDDDKGPCAQSASGPRRMLLPGAMHAAVLAAALAPCEGSGCYPVHSTCAQMFCLPALELTAAKLGQDTKEEVVVMAEEAPGWLPVGVYMPAPDPHRPAEAVGVYLRSCWATEAAEGACVHCRHCIKLWWKDPMVVCREELLLPGKCTRCREAHQRCIPVSPPSPCYCYFYTDVLPHRCVTGSCRMPLSCRRTPGSSRVRRSRRS